jgi:hypothetical protein
MAPIWLGSVIVAVALPFLATAWVQAQQKLAASRTKAAFDVAKNGRR